MAYRDDFKTSSILDFAKEKELRLSVRNGLQEDFMKSVSEFDVNCIDVIVNKRYILEDKQEMTLLIEATICGHINIVKLLLDKFNANIDAPGKLLHCCAKFIEGVSALWCAARYAHFDIVKLLIERGANVNYYTESKSTPLRAACYIGKIDIVKFLINHGANVNTVNESNSTCLMIASQRGDNDILKYLLENRAVVDIQTEDGDTAMHFAAQMGEEESIKLLLEFNATHLKNKQSLTPILVAAERTHDYIVYNLLKAISLTWEEKIEVYELLGASFLTDKDTYNKNLGFSLLLKSMKMRYAVDPVISKKVYKNYDAYDNQIEYQTMKDLMSIKNNPEQLHYQSLIIRERILGDSHPDLLQSIIWRGGIYADLLKFTPCLKLWIHAMEITKKNEISLHDDLQRFIKVFCAMIRNFILIELSDLKNVLEVAVEELKTNQKYVSTTSSKIEEKEQEEIMIDNLLSTLGLVVVTGLTLRINSQKGPLVADIMQIIVKMNKLNLRTVENQTLLHLSLDYDTNKLDIFKSEGILCFPNYFATSLLIFCGADINATDNDKNTPLHFMDKIIKMFPQRIGDIENKNIVMELLRAGAHTDFVNKFGVCPHTGYLKTLYNLTNKVPRSLKCLSASATKKKVPKELYHNLLPKALEEFTELHG